METVLYEYHFDFFGVLPLFIPLIVGVGFLVNSIGIIKSQFKPKGWEGFTTSFSKITGFIVAPITIGMFLFGVAGVLIEHFDIKERITHNDVLVVEGTVEQYHPMPYEGHDMEHFVINGVYFQYSDNVMINGYNNTASHGGVITSNGQKLRIKYIVDEDTQSNVILYIAELDKPNETSGQPLPNEK